MSLRAPATTAVLLASALALAAAAPEGSAPPGPPPFQERLRSAITQHLGKPYVWGATGLKSFDCSGFVWRACNEAGLMMKRTTAKRLYLCLPKVEPGSEYTFGTLVFFSDLEHVGVVDSREAFYHAQTSKGTTRSPFAPYWRGRVYGFRALPTPKE